MVVEVLTMASLLLCALVSVCLLLATTGAAVTRKPERADDSIDPSRLTIVIVTVASDSVWDTLEETIAHTVNQFPSYDVHVLTDEGADRIPDLLANDDIELQTVPTTFEPEHATGKGRALEWFTQTQADDDTWYAFLDDDNRVLDDAFLYEIPAQEAAGKRAMNPVLIPRRGDSVLSFVIDHVRTLFDLTVYRAATGSGRPVFGLHGELLTVRGDTLKQIGFDRHTVAEDFAFADRLYANGIETWQSMTRVSILSPHSLSALVKQRRRWTVGQLQALRDATWGVRAAMVGLHGTWTLGVLTNWFLGLLYLLFTPFIVSPLVWAVGLLGAAAYTLTYATGLYRAGSSWLILSPLIPVIATVEHALPWVIGVLELQNKTNEFEVIDK